MRFFFVKGKQQLDLSGNLILSKNDQLITAPAKSAAPKTRRARYIMVAKLNFMQKLKCSVYALAFIWSRK